MNDDEITIAVLVGHEPARRATPSPATRWVEPSPSREAESLDDGPSWCSERLRSLWDGLGVRLFGQTMWGESRAIQAAREIWANAPDYAALCTLSAEFCLGRMAGTSTHQGPRAQETEEIGEELAHANRVGFLTHNSQPGFTELGEDGHPCYQQRPCVDGFADAQVVARLRELVKGTSLVLHAGPMRRWRWTRVPGEKIDRERVGKSFDFAGLPSAHWVRSWVGFGDCTEEAIQGILARQAVLIYDQNWGANRTLWDVLGRL